MIEEREGVRPPDQRLVFAGRQLEPDEIFQGCSIREDSTIHFTGRVASICRVFINTPSVNHAGLISRRPERVRGFKHSIKGYKHVDLPDSVMYFEGRRLDDDYKFEFPEGDQSAILDLVPRVPGITVFIKNPGGIYLTLAVAPTDLVERVKTRIQYQLRIPCEEQRLYSCGQELKDGHPLQ
jgi:hypothetical protein